MPQSVTDFRGNPNQAIETASKAIGKSAARRKVFAAIYKGHRRFKPISELMRLTKMTRVRVAQEAARLAANHVVEKGKVGTESAYRKDETYSHFQQRILRMAAKPSLTKKYPTPSRPHVTGQSSVTIRVGKSTPQPKMIAVDDVASFSKVRGWKAISGLGLKRMLEKKVKEALKRIIGESHDFKDWGGEQNDLFTTKFKVGSKRVAAAFALKGRATQGTLTPKKMGTNGDQIGRLMSSEATVFFVVYHSKVDQSVHQQMRAHALARSMAGERISYGVIDGDDLGRLYQAYRTSFR